MLSVEISCTYLILENHFAVVKGGIYSHHMQPPLQLNPRCKCPPLPRRSGGEDHKNFILLYIYSGNVWVHGKIIFKIFNYITINRKIF